MTVAAMPLVPPSAEVANAAATTTVAFFSMDEPTGATTLVDSSGNGVHGTIGADVVSGVRVDGAVAHRYPLVPTALPPTHPEHLDRVPDHPLLDPGTSDYAVTVRFRTSNPFGNILQKGQNQTVGGYWKFEAPQGIVTCLFKGSQGEQRAVGSPSRLDDNAWHTVRCERTSTSLTMYVDGVRTGRLNGSTGSISNDRELTIAGKGVCDQITVTCDYFAGDIDYVRIEKGSGGPANSAPTASILPSCIGLYCSFSAAGSTDPDGAIQTYAWSFGDGASGSWITADNQYATAGDYTVSVTVTDDRGATSSTSIEVGVAPVPEVISFVGQASSSANAINHSAVVPPAVQPGDGLLLFFTQNTNASIGEPTRVAGWIPLRTIQGGYATTRVWRKVAGASDAGATVHVALSKQSKGNLIVAAYRGTSQSDPVAAYEAVADTTSTAVHLTPNVGVSAAQSWAVSYWMHGDATTTALTAAPGVTARAAGTQTGGGRVTTLLADSNASLPLGSYGGRVATAPTPSTTSTAWTIVLASDTGPVANVPPTAAFVPTCVDFSCTFDAGGSSDSDGVIQSYSWNFGDGATGTGAKPSHVYSSPGGYTVTMTVVDDDLATASVVDSVTVPVVVPVDVISFVGQASNHALSDSFSVVIPPGVRAGDGLIMFLAEASTASISDPTGVTGWQTLGSVTAGGTLTRAWRKVAGPNDAGATVAVTLGSSVKAGLTVVAYRGTSVIDPVAAFASIPITTNSASRTTPVATVAGQQSWALSYWTHKDSITSALAPPAGLNVRASGTQTSSGRVTTLLADSGGLVGQGTYGGHTANAVAASTAASGWTIVLAPQTGPIPNTPPEARFTASCAVLSCSFDASGSLDSDGTIAGYSWDFGDGAVGEGVDPVHAFAADGTYTVTLTVTDDDLDTATTSKQVTALLPSVDVITFVGQASSSLNATSHTVVVPAAVQAGDGLLLFFAENTTATITDPAGWTVLDSIVFNGSINRVWSRVASASDAGSPVTVSLSAISKAGLAVIAYRGTSAADPVASFSRVSPGASSATHTTPVVPVAGSRSWAVSYWMHKDSATSALAPPAGVAVRASGTQTGGGRVTTLVADSGGPVTSGSYGGISATAAAASATAAAWTIILSP